MEGPSLKIAAERLKPFIGKTVNIVDGNTKIGKEVLLHQKVIDVFSWGKHLVFQFEDYAIRIHFLMWGSYYSEVGDEVMEGEYRLAKEPRLRLDFENGFIACYSCSIKLFEEKNLRKEYDFSVDILSPQWDEQKAFKHIKSEPKELITDILLDQEIFAGVGNIIKNEVMFLQKIHPETIVENIPDKKLKDILKETKDWSEHFYIWRKKYELKKHFKIYRKSTCPICGEKVIRKKLGKRERMTFYCPNEQILMI